MTNAMPKGLIWPQFEDGTPINIGDYVVDEHGNEKKVETIYFTHDGCWRISDFMSGAMILYNGEKCKRPFDDSWEKLEEDAKKGTVGYWGCRDITCSECRIKNGTSPVKFYHCDYCDGAVCLDIIARAKKIAEHERNER